MISSFGDDSDFAADPGDLKWFLVQSCYKTMLVVFLFNRYEGVIKSLFVENLN